jgi:hypothetical protein
LRLGTRPPATGSMRPPEARCRHEAHRAVVNAPRHRIGRRDNEQQASCCGTSIRSATTLIPRAPESAPTPIDLGTSGIGCLAGLPVESCAASRGDRRCRISHRWHQRPSPSSTQSPRAWQGRIGWTAQPDTCPRLHPGPWLLVTEVSPPGEDHGQVVPVGDLDGHLVAHGAARLDDGSHPTLGRQRDGVAKGEIGV